MHISFDTIAHLIADRDVKESPPDNIVRAAVALILRRSADDLEILFIKRAYHALDPWSGHLAFPGGKVEPGEEPRRAAERETCEEVGYDLSTAHYLGQLSDITGTNLPVRVSCYVYGINGCKVKTVINDEVEALFWVGVGELTASERHITTPVRFGDRELDVPAIRLPYVEGTVLWGLTYKLLQQFLEIIAEK